LLSFDLNFDRDETYECGALLLTVLACPMNLDGERSVQIHRSLCARALWLSFAAKPDDWTPISVKPQYVFQDKKVIDRDVRFTEKRLGERMIAGRMAVPFFQRANGSAPALPKAIKRLSINQMAEFVLEDAGQKDSENVEKRVWRPSRGVLHLAAAAALVGQLHSRAGRAIGTETFLQDQIFLRQVLTIAEDLAILAEGDPAFPVKAKTLIRLPLH
jgi:hypothetical protein